MDINGNSYMGAFTFGQKVFYGLAVVLAIETIVLVVLL